MAKIALDAIEDVKEVLGEDNKVSSPELSVGPLKKVFVSIDNTFEDVLKLIESGNDVYFEDSKERLINLTTEQVKELPYTIRTRYTLSCKVSKNQLSLENPDGFREQRLKANPRFASATNRLKIDGGIPGMHYTYKRTDEIGEAQANGYMVVDGDDPVETFSQSEVGGSRKVGSYGNDELVLMKIPEGDYKAHLKSVEDLSKRRKEAITGSAMNEMSRDGGIPFIPGQEK